MRKLFLILVSFILALTLAVAASASGSLTASASASKGQAYRGDEISVVVTVGQITADLGGISVAYDQAALELTGYEWLLSGAESSFNSSKLMGVFAYETPQTISGNFFKCVFKVKADATFSPTAITFSVKAGDQTVTASANLTIACNHSFGGWMADEGAPTHTHTCTICNTPETVAHIWNTGEVTVAATCTSEGVKTITCTGCGLQKTESISKASHKYDNSCDTTCNACGAERKITHKFSSEYTSDKTGHWYQCTVCKLKKDIAAHEPGAEPTEQTAQTCRVCGFVIKPALGHTHDFQPEWSTDSTGHWHACSSCDHQHELAEHEYENSCDKDCNVCGYQRETEHIYFENYLADVNGHWHECRVCGYQLEAERHTPNANGICTGCGHKALAADHSHSYGDAWTWDVEGHWQTCECGLESETEPHTWNRGKVVKKPTDTEDGAWTYRCTVCGAEKTEIIPMGTVISDSFPWVVLLIVGGAVVLGVVIYLIVGAAKGKKKVGKFSEHTQQQEVTQE